jgi:hemoglobin
MASTEGSVYARLGGYDAIAAVVDDLQERLESDPLLGRYWSARRSLETDRRVRQLTIDYIAAATGGPTFYLGRDMHLAHAGMGLTKDDYAAFTRHLTATLEKFKVRQAEWIEDSAVRAAVFRDAKHIADEQEILFELKVERAMHTRWKNVGTPQLRPIHRKWRAPVGST